MKLYKVVKTVHDEKVGVIAVTEDIAIACQICNEALEDAGEHEFYFINEEDC